MFVEYSTGAYSFGELAKKAKEWGLRNKENTKTYLSTSQIHHMIKNPFYYGEMLSVGKLYKHKYPPIIDKFTWDKCQQIRTGRSNSKAPRQTKKPFIFRGLLTCAISGKAVTSDLKKGKYVYLICRDPNNPGKKMFVPEKIVLDQIKDVFQSIRIEKDMLLSVTEHLKVMHDSEKDHQARAITELEKENKDIQKKLDRLLDLLIDESITSDDHERKCQELKNRQYDINEQIKKYLKADESFQVTVKTVLSLASKAYEIFESSNIEQKRKLINYVFSNLQLRGVTLEYHLKKPFDLMVDCTTYSEWLGH
ncbi:MAG TPA: recombinase family protein [Thermodesulfobacteriota bacterium]|nr:recombinase family protein [Thermodesulfobacteriota bacterium]